MRGLIESFSLYLPELPAALEGLRLAHVSDLHIRRMRPRHRAIFDTLAELECDILLLTGDLMHTVGAEPVVHDVVRQLLAAAQPTIGAFGVWGNHDSTELRRRLQHLPIEWLSNRAHVSSRLPLTLLGVDCNADECQGPRGDLLGAVLDIPPDVPKRNFRILLSHMPYWLEVASGMNIPLMFAGHTHGGQLRAPSGTVFFNATPGWPLSLSTGILQARHTFGVVSRGAGESLHDGLRIFCRPHIPLITLHRSNDPIEPAAEIRVVQRW